MSYKDPRSTYNPDDDISSSLVWDYREKFGGEFGSGVTGGFFYTMGEKTYSIPSEMSTLNELMRKSLKTGHDYVLDWVKENGEDPPPIPDDVLL